MPSHMLLLMKSCNKPTVNKLHSSSYADIKMCLVPLLVHSNEVKTLLFAQQGAFRYLFVHLSVSVRFFV